MELLVPSARSSLPSPLKSPLIVLDEAPAVIGDWNVPSPLPSRTTTGELDESCTSRSIFPSPLKSPLAKALEAFVATGDPKEPSPLPSSSDVPMLFEMITSALPSPLKSANALILPPVLPPVAYFVAAANVPLPLPSLTSRVPVKMLPIRTSSLPSPLTSPSRIDDSSSEAPVSEVCVNWPVPSLVLTSRKYAEALTVRIYTISCLPSPLTSPTAAVLMMLKRGPAICVSDWNGPT